jgi:hypothetical protein
MKASLATTTLLALATALLVHAAAAAAPAAAPPAAKPAAVATSTDATLRLDGPDHATAEVRQTWDGAHAKGMRQSLNAIFGNKDDSLSQAELENIANAVGHDLTGRASPFLTWDGQPAMVQNATVTFEGGPGATTSTDPLTMVHAIQLSLTPRESAPHDLVLSPLWNATFRLEWAADWVATAAGALEPPAIAPGSLTARVGQAAPLTVTLGPAQPAPDAAAQPVPTAGDAGGQDAGADGTGAQPEAKAAAETHRLPAPGAWALAAALAGTALLAARKARRER